MRKSVCIFFNLFLLMLFTNVSIHSQTVNWEWARSINGPTNEDEIDAVASDHDANVYISGKFEDTLHFSGSVTPMISAGMADIMLIKYDSIGNLIWAKQFGGTGEDNTFDAVCDLDDNIIISGYFQQTITFDTITLNSLGGFDFFLAKFNPNGNVMWVKQYGGTGNDGGNEVSVDYQNRILVNADSDGPFNAGSFSFGNTGFKDTYILSLNEDGTENWIRPIQGAGTVQGKSVAVDDVGNVYFGGDYLGPNGAIDQLSMLHSFTVSSSRDAFVTSWTPGGNFRWLKNWGGSGNNDLCKGIATNSDGDVYMMGKFSDDVNLDGNIIEIGPQINFYIWKVDSNGNTIWIRHVASPADILEGGEIIEDGNNGIALGLGMTDTLYLETSTTPTQLTLSTANAYPVFIQYNQNGDVVFTKQGDQSYYATFGEISRSGDFIFMDSPYFGTTIFTNDTVTTSTNSNKDDALVCIKISSGTLGIFNESFKNLHYILYPNPAEDVIFLDMENNAPDTKITWYITDINGRIVHSMVLSDYHNILNIELLKSGIYFLKNDKTAIRFIKQ